MLPPTAGPTTRPVALAAAALAACLLTACTGDAGGSSPIAVSSPSTSATSPAPEAAPEAAPEVLLIARNGQVTGRIGRGDRRDVVRRVARVVDGWLEAAYVAGEYPRSAATFDDSAWPGFTDGAARTARADKDLMSNADIADRISGLTVKRRQVIVDVLAVDRTARAATARVRLAFRTQGVDGGFERVVSVTGRVFLTKRNGAWKVFGYDVAKARV